MGAINRQINKLQIEIDKLKNELVEFEILKNDWLSGKRNMYMDYPRWRHPFHRTPMDWVNCRIYNIVSDIDKLRRKQRELLQERCWFECQYYRDLDLIDICELIRADGSISGMKL